MTVTAAAAPITPLSRTEGLYLLANTPKGRAVIASRPIPSGTTIDVSPVLVLDPRENKEHIEKTSLYHYTYNWPSRTSDGKVVRTQAVVFGLGSLFNHSKRAQNVGWIRDLEKLVVTYRALRDIAEGEELCISYGEHLTFVDADAPCEGSESEESDGDEDILARIQLV